MDHDPVAQKISLTSRAIQTIISREKSHSSGIASTDWIGVNWRRNSTGYEISAILTAARATVLHTHSGTALRPSKSQKWSRRSCRKVHNFLPVLAGLARRPA